MSNPGPLAALVYGFILIVLLSVSLILYSIGRTIKNENWKRYSIRAYWYFINSVIISWRFHFDASYINSSKNTLTASANGPDSPLNACSPAAPVPWASAATGRHQGSLHNSGPAATAIHFIAPGPLQNDTQSRCHGPEATYHR